MVEATVFAVRSIKSLKSADTESLLGPGGTFVLFFLYELVFIFQCKDAMSSP